MLSTLTASVIDKIKELDEFSSNPDKFVVRGEFGKLNTTAQKGVIVVSDFKPTRGFGEGEEQLRKHIPFVNNLFIYFGHQKTQADAEDGCLDLTEKVIALIADYEFNINMVYGNKYFKWEMTDIEWVERSASMAVVAVELTMNYQVV